MPDSSHPLILLVDEDDVVRDSLKILLESHGMPVRDFRHARDLLAGGEPAPAACLVIGLNRAIVDGVELLGSLRRLGLDLPVIFVVGGCGEAQKLAALKAGAFAYLERPAGEASLIRTIKAALAGRSRNEPDNRPLGFDATAAFRRRQP